MARTAKQAAASKRNLEAARKKSSRGFAGMKTTSQISGERYRAAAKAKENFHKTMEYNQRNTESLRGLTSEYRNRDRKEPRKPNVRKGGH